MSRQRPLSRFAQATPVQLVPCPPFHSRYDPAGNRTSAGSTSYTWDDFGNLASATSGATTIAYESNGSGLRVSASSGSNTSTYAWDEAAALPALLSDGTNGYLSADATLLAETSASANAYPLTDALGSVRAQTDGLGSLTASASYGVFGSVRSSTGSVGSLGYTGALSDSSGLTYLQARELDSSTGTMLSRDPLTPGGSGVIGYNPYAYAGQNPTTYTDPSGTFAYENAMQGGSGTLPTVKILGWPSAGLSGNGTQIGALVLLGVALFNIYRCLINHEGVCYLFNQSRSNSNSGGEGEGGGGEGGGGGGGGAAGGERWQPPAGSRTTTGGIKSLAREGT